MRDIPVISVDPNGPWRKVGDTPCLFTGVHDTEMVADFRDGNIPADSYVIGYAAYYEMSDAAKRVNMNAENGWGGLYRIEKYTIVDDDTHGRPPWVSLYLRHIDDMAVVPSA